MKNPYKILNLPQDATPSQIVKAQIPALRSRKYSQKDIAEAQSTLRKPALRLAADFTYPILEDDEMAPIIPPKKSKEINWNNLNENKYNSLKL